MHRVFISSVQKELELERAAVAALISTDPFLLKHAEAVRYDKEPPTGRPHGKGYLECLESCDIYVLLMDVEYGRTAGELSATHEEYRLAQKAKLPTLVFVRGVDQKRDDAREVKTKEFFAEIRRDGYKYVRFHDREDLKPALRAALYTVLKKEFAIAASAEESADGDHLIEVASGFGATPMTDVGVGAMDDGALGGFVERVITEPGLRIWPDSAEHALLTRGLAIQRSGQPTTVVRAAYLLFAPRPADRFSQCAILADAYDEPRISGRPKGQLTINAAILSAVERTLKFIDEHTFHPRRVVGLNNLRLHEYPVRALREALINAVAHRNYEDTTRKIIVRVFSDRVEIASPGYPLKPLTLAKLRKGNYRPCSRNPLIAETLALLDQMEQRGTGFSRMHDAMLDHGLDAPVFAEQDGYFVVTFPGPAGNYERLKLPSHAAGPVTPAIEAQLNERQKAIMAEVLQSGTVTRGWCVTKFDVANDTAGRDLKGLTELGLLELHGKGRSARYRLTSTDNRPTKS